MSILKDSIVLYVEDDENIRESVARALRRRVKSIVTAENGKEGLERFLQNGFNIVLTDLEMPIMNGIEMIENIRKETEYKYPIVVITAYRDEEHYTPLADAYIYKPINLEELENTIVELLIKYSKNEK